MKRDANQKTLVVIVIGVALAIFVLLGMAMWTEADKIAALTVSDNADAVQVEQVEPKIVEPTYTQEELFYMAAAIYNEAGGDACSDNTRRLVGYVILNRVNDSRFPDSIKDVLEQERQYGRFHWTGIKFADRASLPQEQSAVDRAYRIARECLEAETIPIPATVVFQAEFEQGIGLYSYQDGIYFCYGQEVK